MIKLKLNEWKPLPETEYSVSRGGLIRNNRTGRILAQTLNSSGYYRTQIRVKGNTEIRPVHRMVASVWIPNPTNLPTVDHIDRDKTNNHVTNLRWASTEMQAANRTKPKTSKYKGVSQKGKYWRSDIRVDGKTIYIGLSQSEEVCAQKYNDYILANKMKGYTLNIIP